jgi:hypothetical protein
MAIEAPSTAAQIEIMSKILTQIAPYSNFKAGELEGLDHASNQTIKRPSGCDPGWIEGVIGGRFEPREPAAKFFRRSDGISISGV